MTQPPHSPDPHAIGSPASQFGAEGYPAPQPGGFPAPQPGSGQPYPGQPYPGQPYPGQQPGGGPFGAPPPKKNTGLLIAIIALAVVLLGGGTAATVYLVRQGKKGTAPTAAPADSLGASPSPSAAAIITLLVPDQLSGRQKIDEPQLNTVTEQLSSELTKNVPNSTKTVSAMYGDMDARTDITLVAGVAAPIADVTSTLDQFVSGMQREMPMSDLTEVDPGPLGGEAQCGSGTASGVDLAVCAWADEGSVGMVGAFFTPVDKLKGEFVTMRGEVEKKG